jgi:hypothetical protein
VVAPKSAVRSDAQGAFAWVVTNGRVRRQPLRAGADQGDQVVILEGLSGGEALVLGPADDLASGDRVVPASSS